MRTSLLCILICFFLQISASPTGDDNNENSVVILTERETLPPPVSRPRMPSNQIIWLHYDAAQGRCSFDIPAGIEVLDVTIHLDDCIYFSAIVTSEEPSFPLSLIHGSYSICCISDAGRLFSASFFIE